MKVGLIGTGSVAQALAEGFLRSKHEVRFGSRDPSKARAKVAPGAIAVTQKDAATWADVVILAVPYRAVRDTVDAIGAAAFRGKVVVDATNVLSPSGGLAVGVTTSGAEELAKAIPGANVVKAFNAVFAGTMATGKVGDEQLTLFVAGDDRPAKETVLQLAADIGFDAVDAGPLRSARYLEPMALQMITLAYTLGMGWRIGVRLVRAGH